MGGGPTRRAEKSKGAPFNLGRALDGEAGAPGPDDAAFCKSVQAVGFRLLGDAPLEVGDAVRAVPGSPPLLSHLGQSVAAITDGEIGIAGCLELRYRMAGEVTAFDPGSRTGEAALSGRRPNG